VSAACAHNDAKSQAQRRTALIAPARAAATPLDDSLSATNLTRCLSLAPPPSVRARDTCSFVGQHRERSGGLRAALDAGLAAAQQGLGDMTAQLQAAMTQVRNRRPV
jgi:hypothetical protein